MAMLLAALLLGACGRIGFGAGEQPQDAVDDVASVADSAIDATPAPVAAGLVLWLAMEDSPADGLADNAVAPATTCTGACPAQVAGHRGLGLRFDRQLVRVAERADLQTSQPFSAAAWVKLEQFVAASETYGCVFGKHGTLDDSFELCWTGAGTTAFYTSDDVGQDFLYGPTLALDTWHHLAMTWDGTTKRAFVDGQLAGSAAVAISTAVSDPGIGASTHLTPYESPMIGVVDEVMFWDRRLTAAEIAAVAAF